MPSAFRRRPDPAFKIVSYAQLRSGDVILHGGHASPLVVSDMRTRDAVLCVSLNGNSRWLPLSKEERTMRLGKQAAEQVRAAGYAVSRALLGKFHAAAREKI